MKKTNLIITIAAIMALVSCGKTNGGSQPHKDGDHEWIQTKIVQPTCTEEGYINYSCECGEEKTEAIDKLEHSWYKVVTDDGHYETCSSCEATRNETEHTWLLTQNIEATCTEEGRKEYKCSECDRTKVDVIEAKSHNPGEWIIDNETHNRTCSNCGLILDTNAHEFEDLTTPASCTEDGHFHKVCKDCGYSIESTIEATGHVESYVSVNDQRHKIVCATCGETIREFAHNYKEQVIKKVDCENDGLVRKTCSLCDHSVDEVVKAEGHKYMVYRYDETSHTYKCGVCSKTDTRLHTLEGTRQESTCEQDGIIDLHCTACDYSINERVEAKGHDYEYTSVDGEKHVAKCKTCGAKVEEIHTLSSKEIAASVSNCAQTITECSLCGYENIEYTGPHEGGHQVTAKDQYVEISEEKCGTVCKIPGCNYVYTQKNHYFATKKIFSYPEGDQPGTEAAACVYCFKTREVTEFTGTKVDKITVTMPVMPAPGIPLKDWWSYTVEENVSSYATYKNGVRIQGLFLTCANDDMYSFNNDLDTVLTEEQLAGPYTLTFYFNNAANTYWEWDNENMVPAIELTLNNQYRARVTNANSKMSGYWAFQVTIG